MKFRHEGGRDSEDKPKEHPAECTTCHINITKAATLRGLKPDVPIFPSCASSSCHKKVLDEELGKLLAGSPMGAFKCMKCHTSDVGGKRPPDSHYLAAERPIPGR